MLKIDNLKIAFGKKNDRNVVVSDVSFELKKGQSLGIVGESGSGKSLTALAIMKLLPKQAILESGEIIFKDREVLSLSESKIRKLRGKNISMIFQEPMTSLNPVMKCGKQVNESIILHQKISAKEAKKKTISLFKKVNLPRPESIYNSYPHQLSGGQKQRIMIAMAIANKPDLLIADEPTTALDVTVQKEIIALLNSLRNEYGMSLIFISHDLGVIREVADEVIVMYKGKIVEKGKIDSVYNNPQNDYTKGLLACRPVGIMKGNRLPEIEDFVSGKIKTSTPIIDERSELIDNKDILKIENLSKRYITEKSILGKTNSYVNAVDNVSFNVIKGETLGLVGESGCGKTTLSRAILRLIDTDSGEIFFNDADITKYHGEKLRKERKNINIVFQDPYSSLNPRMTIGEAILEPMIVHNIGKSKKERLKTAKELLVKVGLSENQFYRYPHEFSGGQRQRIVIARALALNPEFIICDEAVSALDVSVQAKVLNLLNDLKKEFGFTYIFISHDLNVVRYMSDRIIVMKDGKIVEAGDSEEIFNNPKKEYTKRLIKAIPVS